jgi:signal transduction histidine kinase
VYRIVQEALTNVRRHAGASLATVTLAYDTGELVLEVTDDGPGRAVTPPHQARRDGHGMLGMRERTSLFGGTLAAGPVPGGGFRVSARIPLPEEVR